MLLNLGIKNLDWIIIRKQFDDDTMIILAFNFFSMRHLLQTDQSHIDFPGILASGTIK